MRGLLLVLGIGFALLATRAGADEEVPSPDPSHVLVLGPDGLPLAGAHLMRSQHRLEGTWLFDADGPTLAQSDAHGRVDALPARREDPGPLVAWSPGLGAVALPPGPAGATVRLMPAEETGGRVRLARGQPAASAEVIVLPVGGALDLGHRTRADARGRFSFPGLAAGRWRLLLRHADGRVRSLGLVQAGQDLGLRAPRSDTGLVGQVLDADGHSGAAASGITLRFEPLTVLPREAPVGALEVRTDPSGRFRVDGLDPGVHRVRLVDADWAFEEHAPHVEAQAGRVRELATWFAFRRRAVHGSVLDADGEPLAGARLRLVPDPAGVPPAAGYEPLPSPARSDAQGAYRLERAMPAEGYRLVASRDGFSPWISNPFRVDRGRDTILRPFRMHPGWRLRVRVRDGGGRPIQGARVRATAATQPSALSDPAWATILREGRTDAGGQALLVDLPADDALCVVEAEGWLARSEVVPYPRISDLGRLDVNLEPAGVLTGQVQVLEGGPQGPFLVRARTRDGRETHEVTTAADGRFRFAALRDTATDFDVRAAGRRAATVLAEVPNVVPGVEQHLEIVVPALHALRGSVRELDLDGPAPTVVVETLRFDRTSERYRWTTIRRVGLAGGGSSIPYEVGGLPPGAYTVRAVQGWNDSEPLSVQIDAGDAEGLDLLLPAGARIAGAVLDGEGGPLLGARVRLVRLHGEDPAAIHAEPLQHSTDERGEYAFTSVAPGLWRVTAGRPEAAPDVEVVRVLGGEVRVVRDLVLASGGMLEGRVEDTAGRPLDGVRVHVRRFDDEGDLQVVRSDAQGTFRVRHLREGAYHVRIQAGTIAAGPEVEAVVEVPASGVARADFVAAAEAAIEGTVLRRGQPVAGALVDLVHEPPAPSEPLRRFRTSTDGAGRFEVRGLPAGAYRIQLQSGAWRTEQALMLEEGDRLQLDLEGFEARLRGTVQTVEGDPVPGAHLLALPLGEEGHPDAAGAFVGEGRTDPRGEFTLRGLPVGGYTLLVSAPGLPPGRLERVEADLPGADFRVEVVLGRGGSLQLRTRDEDDRGVTGARVWIEDESGTALQRHAFVTGAAGRLRIDGLPPGTVLVRVHARGMGRPALRRVTIEEGGATALEIPLRAAGTLRLVVTGEFGDPLGRARIDLVRPSTGEVLASRRPLSPVRLPEPWGHVPRTGVVDIPDLEEGSYVARITAGRSYETAEVPVDVRAGARSTVEVTLAPAGGAR